VYGGFAGAQGGVDHLADGNSERADLTRKIEMKPPRLTRRGHRDDHLVKAQEIEGVAAGRSRRSGWRSSATRPESVSAVSYS